MTMCGARCPRVGALQLPTPGARWLNAAPTALASGKARGILPSMRQALILAFGFVASPALSQDVKVLLCTAESQWNLSSAALETVASDETYTWELRYEGSELVSLSAPFDCVEGTEEWDIGETVISMECQQNLQNVAVVRLSAEIDRYAQSFMISGVREEQTDPPVDSALWVQEGQCVLARRKF